MTRAEAELVAGDSRQPTAAGASEVQDAAGIFENDDAALEKMKKDIMTEVVKDTLKEAPPTYLGTCADGATELEWLGGKKGLRTIVLRRVCFKPPMEGDELKVPVDAAIVGKAAGQETYGIAAGLEKPMDEAKMKKITVPFGLLQPDVTPEVNWERWFQAFEQEARRLSIPLEQWPKLLAWLTAPELLPVVLEKQGACTNLYGVPPRLVYGAIRDMLLGTNPAKYGAWSYLKRLFSIEPGARSARDLAHHLTMLARDYECARKRATAWLERYPEISGSALARIYYDALPDNVRERVQKPEEQVTEPQKSRYDRLVQMAIEQEAGLPASARTVNVAAVVPQKGKGQKDNKKRRADDDNTTRSTSIKRLKFRCYHCGVEGHAIRVCRHYAEWVEPDPQRRLLCAKCGEPGHRTQDCPYAVGKFWGKYKEAKETKKEETKPKEGKDACLLVKADSEKEEGEIPQSPPSLPALLANVASALELGKKAAAKAESVKSAETNSQLVQAVTPQTGSQGEKRADRLAEAFAMLQTPSSGTRTPVTEEPKNEPPVALVTAPSTGAKTRSPTPESVKRSRLLATDEKPNLEAVALFNPHVKRALERAANDDKVGGPYTLQEERAYEQARHGCKIFATFQETYYDADGRSPQALDWMNIGNLYSSTE